MTCISRASGPRWILTLSTAALLLASPLAAQERAPCEGCGDAAALIARFQLREGRAPMREVPGWSAPQRIVVAFGREIVDPLRAAAPGAEVIAATTREETVAALAEADVWVGSCSAWVLEAAKRLRWIQLPSAGAESCANLPEVAERGIVVTNAQGLYGPQVAEHALAMILSFARALHAYHPEQRAGAWSHRPTDQAAAMEKGIWELEHKTLLVVGLGGIGTELARRAHALGMRVTATRNSRREGPPFVEYVGLAHEVERLAAEADVVVNATPLTPETTGLFDAAFFRAMKPTGLFINVGRGESVVTEDLVAALQSGQIAGAGLDVTDPEPLPPGHPLWTMPNVILTPHSAAASDQLMRRFGALLVENVRRYAAGERLLSVVDLERGY